MKSTEFRLPHVAFPQLKVIIQQYYKASSRYPCGLSSGELSQLTLNELTLKQIADCVTFLCNVGILEPAGKVERKKKYRSTKLGEELGCAIEDSHDTEKSSICWARVVNENTFLKEILDFISFNGRVELDKFKQYIASEAGRKPTGNAQINAKTIVDILHAGKFVSYEVKGKRTTVTIIKAEEHSRYIIDDRITSLNTIKSKYDLRKLIELCNEINFCYEKGFFYAVGILVRAVIDHVPPIFGCKNFDEVANNYSVGSRSFREHMQILNGSTRKIADTYAHEQVKVKMDLPNPTQVKFSADIDVLLGEIIRILTSKDN